MLYILLGQLTIYLAVWAIVVLIHPGLQLPLLAGAAVFGEIMFVPMLDSNATIKSALQTGCLSRWWPYVIGMVGAVGWIGAVVLTWWLLSHWTPSDGVVVTGCVLSCVWVICGVPGAVIVTERIARTRLLSPPLRSE